MKAICIHWTAGPYAQTGADFEHYHFTVGKDGAVAKGRFSPEDNIPPLVSGQYAAHCGGGNSNAIGVSLRGMAGYQNPEQMGKFPLTEKQCEAAWKLCAELCHKYGIPVTEDTVYTHYEFGRKHPKTTSRGKIDINHLPYKPNIGSLAVGDFIRNKVRWYLEKLRHG